MESYNTNKQRNVVQLSVFVLPEEKEKIESLAREENRSVSNYVKTKLMGVIAQ